MQAVFIKLKKESIKLDRLTEEFSIIPSVVVSIRIAIPFCFDDAVVVLLEFSPLLGNDIII